MLRGIWIFEFHGYGSRVREVVFFTPWYHAEMEAGTEIRGRAEKCIFSPHYDQTSILPPERSNMLLLCHPSSTTH